MKEVQLSFRLPTTRKGYPNGGLNIRRTKRGVIVIEMDWWADPGRDRDWELAMRRLLGDQTFEREYCRNWSIPSGLPFYPEFKQRVEQRILTLPGLIPGPIYRGWDFGYRRPACVWFQYSPRQRRIWALRELMPADMDIWSFRALVLYASGERPIEYLEEEPRGLEWMQRINEDPAYPKMPWFRSQPSDPLKFIDYAGPEANWKSAVVRQHEQERSYNEVLAAAGINLGIRGMEVTDRVEVVRKLLHFHDDGFPAMLIDPRCPLLIKMFNGGLTFKPKTASDPLPNVPNKDGFYDNIHDAFGYGVEQVVDLVAEEDVERALPIVVEMGNRELALIRPDQLQYNSIALKEMRVPWGDGF